MGANVSQVCGHRTFPGSVTGRPPHGLGRRYALPTGQETRFNVDDAYPVTVIVYVTFWLAGPNVGVPDSVAAKLMWWTPAESGASMM
jgi:hypothetical protein